MPTARLIDGIWGAELPTGAANAPQALVSRPRRAVPRAHVESHPAGYRLVVGPDAVDVACFERPVASAHAAPAAEAARILREALGLWRGPALLDVADNDFFRAPVVRLEELRLAALEDRVDADVRLGRGAELTAELASLVAEHPLWERLVGALVRALAAAGRPAEALAAGGRLRRRRRRPHSPGVPAADLSGHPVVRPRPAHAAIPRARHRSPLRRLAARRPGSDLAAGPAAARPRRPGLTGR